MTGFALFWLGTGVFVLVYLFGSFVSHTALTIMNRLNPDRVKRGDYLWPIAWPFLLIAEVLSTLCAGASRISNWIANYVTDWVAPMIASSKNEPEQLEVGETYRQPPHCSSCGKLYHCEDSSLQAGGTPHNHRSKA